MLRDHMAGVLSAALADVGELPALARRCPTWCQAPKGHPWWLPLEVDGEILRAHEQVVGYVHNEDGDEVGYVSLIAEEVAPHDGRGESRISAPRIEVFAGALTGTAARGLAALLPVAAAAWEGAKRRA